jgi:nitrite reductase (NADH) large subunit
MIKKKKIIIIIGNGMTSVKFCQKLVEAHLTSQYSILVIGEEKYLGYDRVHLTDYYTGKSIDELTLASSQWYSENGIDILTGNLVTEIDREEKIVKTQHNESFLYDILVFATGSSAFVPPIPGVDKTGVFVYRTFEDLDAIKTYVKDAKKGIVIGGGLLGLEAAKAIMDDNVETTTLERMPWLMGRQLDERGASMLQSKLEKQGLKIITNANTACFEGEERVKAIRFADGTSIVTDIVVISAGIKPRDELARKAGLDIGKNGGIVVNEGMQTSSPDIYAIGECALAAGSIWGLVSPCYQMAEVLVEHLKGEEKSFTGADMSTKLKLIGTEVASFGDALGQTPGSIPLILENKLSGIYKRLNVSDNGKYLLGGILVGDTADYNMLLQAYKNKIKLPANPESMLVAPGKGGGLTIGVLDLPEEAAICSCEGVSKGKICHAIEANGFNQIADIKKHTRAGTGCGGCVPMLDDLLTATLKKQGKEVKKVLCEHFSYTRQDLYDLIKIEGITNYHYLLKKHGKGSGCEICKPAVASLLASIWNETIVKHDVIQDTNDRFLANIQRGGTYSVVPRIPGGEITPQKLETIGRIAQKYDLYCKITGGQRIDLFGARVDQLPYIWEELIAEGFESGHAYGKALRTVKSCVGSTWCRFGLHDSVGFAIEIENRYKGLRAPHKIKGGVSGCIRECAEARGKDFGIIATEKGWNLYVCGNGGSNPAHAILLAADIDKETCIKYLDRFLMYYIKTAAPLTRTAKWLNSLEGGIDHLKEVVINDSLGLADEFERDMQRLVDTYKCEWKEVIENPEIRRKFKAFVNSNEHDTNIEFVPMREQKMPVPWGK